MDLVRMKEVLRKLKHKEEILEADLKVSLRIPEMMPDFEAITMQEGLDLAFSRRLEACVKSAYQSAGMFGFVSWRWVTPLVRWIGNRRCLEVMAGRGWLSSALREKQVQVIATDNYSWFGTKQWNVPLTDILSLDAVDAVQRYGKEIDVLICSWPWLDDTMYRLAKALHYLNSEAVVLYIGEGPGGVTADDQFHLHFQDVRDDDFDTRVSPMYEQWEMHHDTLRLGRYNKNIIIEKPVSERKPKTTSGVLKAM